ncbi:uncharacterized protein EI90DRAFT_3037417, partial [Cantharellus anzutake]|uniref:uncharacterized protein n=1 Tax=Cantharellus anzutake TaxID=1750568 RepID=UPI00190728D8
MNPTHLSAPSNDSQQTDPDETDFPLTPFPLRAPHRFCHGPSPLSRFARDERYYRASASSSWFPCPPAPPPDLLQPYQPRSPDWWQELYTLPPGFENASKRGHYPLSGFFMLGRLCARESSNILDVPLPAMEMDPSDDEDSFMDDDEEDDDSMDLDDPCPHQSASPEPRPAFPFWSIPLSDPHVGMLQHKERNPEAETWLRQYRWHFLHSFPPLLYDYFQAMLQRRAQGGLTDTDIHLLASYQSLPIDVRTALDPAKDIHRLFRALNTPLGKEPDGDMEEGCDAPSVFPSNVPSHVLPRISQPSGETKNKGKFERERRDSFPRLQNISAMHMWNTNKCQPMGSVDAQETLEYEAERDLTRRWFISMASRECPIDMRKHAMALRWKRVVWGWNDFGMNEFMRHCQSIRNNRIQKTNEYWAQCTVEVYGKKFPVRHFSSSWRPYHGVP